MNQEIIIKEEDQKWLIYKFNKEKDYSCEVLNSIMDLTNTLQKHSDITLLPSDSLLALHKKNYVILCSKGHKDLIELIYSDNLSDYIWEVEENIDFKGKIQKQLTEPEINKALRFIFSKKKPIVFLSLTNSIANSRHQVILKNVLLPAKIKAQTINL